MAGRRSVLVASLVAALAIAGCVRLGSGQPVAAASHAGEPAAGDHAHAEAAPVALAIDGKGCNMGGAVAFNFFVGDLGFITPAPFKPRDTSFYSGLLPDTNGMNLGNYHTALVCEEWEANGHHTHMGTAGFVGLAIEAPPYNVTPAKHNFLISSVATHDLTVTKAVQDAGFFVYPAQISFVAGDMLGIPGVNSGVEGADALIETAGDGIYESSIHLADKHTIESLRLWLILDRPDGLHPAYLDLNMTPGKDGAMYYGNALFTHTQTSKHPGGAAAQNSGSLSFLDFELHATLTMLPETVKEMWNH